MYRIAVWHKRKYDYSMLESIEDITRAISPVFKKYGVKYAGLFGSQARGDARPDSDIDILVTLGDKPLSLWDFVGLKDELSECLKKPVDLLSDRAVVPYFRDYIYRDLKKIYGER